MGQDAILTIGGRLDKSQVFREVSTGLAEIERMLGNRGGRQAGALGAYTNNFKDFSKSIDAAVSRVTAFGLTAGIFLSIKRSIQGVVTATVEVEKGLKDINIILSLSSRNLKMFSEDLFKVAKDTGQTFQTAAKAATEFSRQGLGVQETLKRTRDALILSRLAGMDATEAVMDLTAAVNSFSDSILDSTQLVSKFVAVDQRFAVSSADLAEAIKRVGSTAQDAGVDIDQLIGLVTSLQEKTARGGSVIGNALKTIFTRAQGPEALDTLRSFGVAVEDLNNNLLPTITILQNLVTTFDQLGQTDKNLLANKLGGVYQINQLKSLLKDLSRGERSTAAQAGAIAGGAGNDALIKNQQFNETLAAKLNETAQNLKLAFSRIGEVGLSSNMKSLLDFSNSLLNVFNQTNEIETVGENIGKGLIKGIGNAIIGPGGLGLLLVIAKVAIEAFKKVGEALKSFTYVQAQFRKELIALTGGENGELQRQQAIYQGLAAATNAKLAAEREILATMRAQNVAKGGGGGFFGSGGGIVRPNAPGSAGIPRPLSVSPTPMKDNRGPLLTVPTGTNKIMGRIGAASRRLNEIEKLLLNPSVQNDPQMMRIINEERKIAQSELKWDRLLLNQDRKDIAQRESDLSGVRRDKANYITSSPRFARISQAAEIEAKVREGNTFAAIGGLVNKDFQDLAARDAKEASQINRDIRQLKIRDKLIEPAGQLIFGGKERALLQRIDPEGAMMVREKRMGKIQNRAMMASFLGPVMGSTFGEATFSGETRGDRMGKTASSAVGNMAGYAGMGLMMGGGVGAAIGAAAGGLMGMLQIFREMSTILPEVNAGLDRIKEGMARGDERIQKSYQITEMAEGLRSGRIKRTDANIKNFRNLINEQTGGLLGEGVSAKQLQELLADQLSGDPDRIDKHKNVLRDPTLMGRGTFKGFLSQLDAYNKNPNEDSKKAMFSALASLQTGAGENFLETQSGTSFAKRALLGPLQFPQSRNGLSNKKTQGLLSGDISDLESVFANAQHSPDDLKNLMLGLNQNPETAKLIFDYLQNKPNASTGGMVTEWLSKLSPEQQGVSRKVDHEIASLLAERSINNAGFFGSLESNAASQAADFSVLQARNEARLAMSGLTNNPMQLAGLAGGIGEEEIQKRYKLSLGALNIDTGKSLSSGVTALRKGLPTNIAAQFDAAKGGLSVLDGLAKAVASGEEGAGEKFATELNNFKTTLSQFPDTFNDLKQPLADLEMTLIDQRVGQTGLRLSVEAQAKSLDVLTQLNKEMADPMTKAKLSLQQFRDGLEEERARFNTFKAAGVLFSDEAAAGQANIVRGDIATNKLSGKGVISASLGGFADQLKYEIKDMYRDLHQGAIDVGSTLKASFKDAFKSFVDGSASASDALRNLGLSFADKLLDISTQNITNMLFGSLQGLGSAAWSAYRPATGATGGYVTGGSGIRDDVPAMLSEGDFVLRRSSVQKYGASKLNALNFASGGGVNIRPGQESLSNFALSDENSPQNRLRMESESNDLNALIQYTQAKKAFNEMKKQRRIGALINLGVGLGAAGIQTGAKAWSNGSGTRGLYDAPAGYGSQNVGMAASGGLMTGRGVKAYAGGGSVDNVPALLTGGEYVMNRNAVSRLGVGFMHKLNRGELPAFNTGGYVGESVESSGANNGNNLNESISRLINSNEKLRSSMEGGNKGDKESASSAQPTVGNVNITIHVSKSGETKAEVETTNKGKENNDVDQGKRLGEAVRAAVIEVINKETRNGGILEQNFQRRR